MWRRWAQISTVGRTWQKVSGDPTTGSAVGKRAKRPNKERAAMDRCYEVDTRDRVEMTRMMRPQCRGGNEHAVEGEGRV